MNPPSRIKLGGHDWAVRVRENIGDGRFVFGRTSARDALIELDRGQSPVQLRDTLLHELLHACMSMLGSGQRDEEDLAAALSPWLLAALRNNPRLISFLTEK